MSNPALEFNGTKYFRFSEVASGILETESFNMFVVFKQNSYRTNGGTQDARAELLLLIVQRLRNNSYNVESSEYG